MMALPTSTTWAMEPGALAALYDRAPTALEDRRPFELEPRGGIGERDGTAILYVTGPLFHHESFASRWTGGATYDRLALQFQRALASKSAESILLYVDSPGGEANGADDLAATIDKARGVKPITAFVSGMACSAAYWIATAASRVTVSEAAVLGSIGVAMAVRDTSARDERRGVKRLSFVSSQSPAKGFAPERVQKMVDAMGDVFVKAVARQRGVSPETVMRKFGAGGVEVGRKAVALGMADAVGSFESALAAVKRQPTPIIAKSVAVASVEAVPEIRLAAAPTAAPIALTNAERIRAEAAAKAERAALARIRSICQSPEGVADPDRAAHFTFNTELTADAAIAALRQEKIAATWRAAAARINP